MIKSIARLLRIIFRERPVELKPGLRYRVTLDLEKVRPGMAADDVNNWLLTLGYTPTTDPKVWKGEERMLRRLPAPAIRKAEKL